MLANLNDVLLKAQRERYAVGLFNTIDTDMLQGALDAAESLEAPIIIGTAEVLLPYGELSLIAPSVVTAAKQASIPVVVHYDHGLTFERCMEALRLGFSSIMYDGSAMPYEQNIAQTREIVRIAHEFGATVEGEIGHVGNADGSDGNSRYTTVKEAQEFVNDTGVDALAIAIGTSHGAYRTAPQLSFERLAEIRNAVSIPLVLHGGSGLSDEDFRRAVENGVSKINIFTDLCIAGMKADQEAVDKKMNYLEARNLKKDAISLAVASKIQLFGCGGKK